MKRSALAAVAGVLLVGVLSEVVSAQTLEATRAAFTKGSFSDAVEAADRTLNRRDVRLTAQDQYDLLMLKAEALLQMKKAAPAQRHFQLAAQVAPEIPLAAAANANALLLTRAASLKYTPRSGPTTQPVDVVDREHRKEAILALARDMVSPVQRDVDAAMQATTLPPIENALQEVYDFYSLKVTAGENAEDARSTIDQIQDKTRMLLRNELDRVAHEVTAIERISDSYDNYSGGRRGLGTEDRARLQDVQTYVQRVHDRLASYRRLSQRFGGKPEEWNQLIADAVDLQYRINTTLRFAVGT